MSKLQELKEQKEEIHGQLVKLSESLPDGQNFDAEQLKQWDALEGELKDVDAAIATAERLLSLNTEPENDRPKGPVFLSRRNSVDTSAAFRGWALGNSNSRDQITSEMRSAMEAGNVRWNEPLVGSIQWNQTKGVDAEGGHTVNDAVVAGVVRKMKDFGGMMLACHVFTTTGGQSLKKPILDSTNFKGSKTAELGTIGNNTQQIDKATFGATEITSGIYPVSYQLMRDSAYDILGEFQSAVGESLGRVSNELLTTGSANDEPQGIQGAVTAITPVGISHANILELFHSVDAAYRRSPRCAFMMSDATLLAVKKALIDADGRPMYKSEPNTVTGFGYVMEGKPVVINTDLATGTILFGDFGKFHVRMVGGVTIKTLTELYAVQNAVGIIGHSAVDGRLVDNTAIKKLNAA